MTAATPSGAYGAVKQDADGFVGDYQTANGVYRLFADTDAQAVVFTPAWNVSAEFSVSVDQSIGKFRNTYSAEMQAIAETETELETEVRTA